MTIIIGAVRDAGLKGLLHPWRDRARSGWRWKRMGIAGLKASSTRPHLFFCGGREGVPASVCGQVWGPSTSHGMSRWGNRLGGIPTLAKPARVGHPPQDDINSMELLSQRVIESLNVKRSTGGSCAAEHLWGPSTRPVPKLRDGLAQDERDLHSFLLRRIKPVDPSAKDGLRMTSTAWSGRET